MIDPIQISKAKQKVVEAYERSLETKRKWLETHLDSYGNFSNRISLYALEGSPIKGMVIVNHGRGLVLAFDAWGKPIRLQNTNVRRY